MSKVDTKVAVNDTSPQTTLPISALSRIQTLQQRENAYYIRLGISTGLSISATIALLFVHNEHPGRNSKLLGVLTAVLTIALAAWMMIGHFMLWSIIVTTRCTRICEEMQVAHIQQDGDSDLSDSTMRLLESNEGAWTGCKFPAQLKVVAEGQTSREAYTNGHQDTPTAAQLYSGLFIRKFVISNKFIFSIVSISCMGGFSAVLSKVALNNLKDMIAKHS